MTRILEITNNKAGLKNTSLKASRHWPTGWETFKKKQAQKGIKDQKLIHQDHKCADKIQYKHSAKQKLTGNTASDHELPEK